MYIKYEVTVTNIFLNGSHFDNFFDWVNCQHRKSYGLHIAHTCMLYLRTKEANHCGLFSDIRDHFV